MTRENLMEYARTEIRSALKNAENRLMNVVERAWAEGNRNAEINEIVSLLNEALERKHEDDPNQN